MLVPATYDPELGGYRTPHVHFQGGPADGFVAEWPRLLEPKDLSIELLACFDPLGGPPPRLELYVRDEELGVRRGPFHRYVVSDRRSDFWCRWFTHLEEFVP